MISLLAMGTFLAWGCESADKSFSSDDDDDGTSDGDSDGDSDTDADGDSDTDTEYTGPAIPETCAQAAEATTTVGCLFYAVDLDSHDGVETQQYAVAVSNVNQNNPAHVEVYQGNAATSGWDLHSEADVGPMSLHVFNLPDYHMDGSGVMAKGSYKVVSDVPIIAYQFNPVDGASSYLSDASMLIPVASLALTYDVMGWKQTQGDGDMRAYFTVVATVDGTVVTVEPSVAPLAGGVVPGTGAPFTVNLDDGDVLEVQTNNLGDSLMGSRITANDGHPIAVFSGQECAFIPMGVYACDHLEEQLPGLRFWGKEMVAARMPVRSTAAASEAVLWQIYVSENDTQITLSASAGVTGLDWTQATFQQGQFVELWVAGNQAQPGDFFIQADKPIAVMQYMIGSENPNCNSIGDPAMVYTSPAEQFLPRYVVLVPGTWIYDTLIITRHAGVDVLLDGATVPNSAFVQVANSGYEVARIPADDGIHTLASADPQYGLAVVVVGYDQWDSYAYAGGMGMGAINPVVE
jgi:hypothetical protein